VRPAEGGRLGRPRGGKFQLKIIKEETWWRFGHPNEGYKEEVRCWPDLEEDKAEVDNQRTNIVGERVLRGGRYEGNIKCQV